MFSGEEINKDANITNKRIAVYKILLPKFRKGVLSRKRERCVHIEKRSAEASQA